MMPLAVATLLFLAIVLGIVGVWWFLETRRAVRERLRTQQHAPSADIVRPAASTPGPLSSVLGSDLRDGLTRLVVQSGLRMGSSDLVLLIGGFALVGGAIAWWRTGWLLVAAGAAVVAGVLPLVYVAYKRYRRLQQLEKQFPEALDMISRSVRAGNALSAAIRLVGEDMPDPIGHEFRLVSEEIRLGMDPSDALARVETRAPIQDMPFFCTAIRIQRASGGNLAETLDRLAEVIRERFKILSYARVLAAQHKWAAILVGLSPVVLALVFSFLHPGYFEPLLTSPIGPYFLGAGLILEAIGFFSIWRIANIKV